MTDASGDDLLAVVRETAEGYDVFGELGREGDDDVWFLARKTNHTALVALRLRQVRDDAAGDADYSLEVARELNAHVSMEQGACSACNAQLRTFAAFCGKCGADQTKDSRAAGGAGEKQALLESVREAASAHYEVLGEMPWTGAGSVYFALESSTGLLVRLRLRDTEGGFELKETRVGMTLAGAVTATYTTSPVGRSSRPIVRYRPSESQAQAASQPARPPSPARPPGPVQPAISDARYRTLLYAAIGLAVVAAVLLVLLLVR